MSVCVIFEVLTGWQFVTLKGGHWTVYLSVMNCPLTLVHVILSQPWFVEGKLAPSYKGKENKSNSVKGHCKNI